MRKFRVTICIILLSAFSPLLAQDYMNLFCDESGAYYFNTEVSPGYTLFSLSKASGTPVSGLLLVNNKENANLNIGERLKIVISTEKVMTGPANQSLAIPLYYSVKRGDNLYRLANDFNRSSSSLMELNGKSHSDLEIDEKILVGWMSWPFRMSSNYKHSLIAQLDDLDRLRLMKPFSTQISPALFALPGRALTDDTQKPPKKIIEKGIAYWEKVDYTSQELIVMHPTARVNSKISLYNPMLNRKVDAKVVSELLREAYPKDISVVISPSVANALGALDRRFLVEITYVE